jgi:hypothetical protein
LPCISGLCFDIFFAFLGFVFELCRRAVLPFWRKNKSELNPIYLFQIITVCYSKVSYQTKNTYWQIA